VDNVVAISTVSVTAHAACVLLLALTFAHVARLFAWSYLRHWALAWGALLLAVLSVRLYIATGWHGFWATYLLSEWLFLAFLYSGCHELATGARVALRRFLPALPFAVLLAVALVPWFADFNQLFSLQAAILSVGFAASLFSLRAVRAPHRTTGYHLMRAALTFLTLLFLAYVPLYFLHEHWRPFAWLGYSSLADLCGQLLLGFGMVFVLSEEAQRGLTHAVAELRQARDQLALQARLDPLTGALNRHAFEEMERSGMLDTSEPGALAMIDLDHLKDINDSAGHRSGDAAIQAAAAAIRAVIRNRDLLFRWGGDEFLAVLPGCDAPTASERFGALQPGIPCSLPAGGERLLRLSWGVAGFGGAVSLHEAIGIADRTMYRRRADSRPGIPSPFAAKG
jgi:diguanylate cyclase (GGDEF)-like protein